MTTNSLKPISPSEFQLLRSHAVLSISVWCLLLFGRISSHWVKDIVFIGELHNAFFFLFLLMASIGYHLSHVILATWSSMGLRAKLALWGISILFYALLVFVFIEASYLVLGEFLFAQGMMILGYCLSISFEVVFALLLVAWGMTRTFRVVFNATEELPSIQPLSVRDYLMMPLGFVMLGASSMVAHRVLESVFPLGLGLENFSGGVLIILFGLWLLVAAIVLCCVYGAVLVLVPYLPIRMTTAVESFIVVIGAVIVAMMNNGWMLREPTITLSIFLAALICASLNMILGVSFSKLQLERRGYRLCFARRDVPASVGSSGKFDEVF